MPRVSSPERLFEGLVPQAFASAALAPKVKVLGGWALGVEPREWDWRPHRGDPDSCLGHKGGWRSVNWEGASADSVSAADTLTLDFRLQNREIQMLVITWSVYVGYRF